MDWKSRISFSSTTKGERACVFLTAGVLVAFCFVPVFYSHSPDGLKVSAGKEVRSWASSVQSYVDEFGYGEILNHTEFVDGVCFIQLAGVANLAGIHPDPSFPLSPTDPWGKEYRMAIRVFGVDNGNRLFSVRCYSAGPDGVFEEVGVERGDDIRDSWRIVSGLESVLP